MKKKLSAMKKKKLSAVQLRNELIDIAKELGFKVSDRETTKGAVKVWLDRPIDSDEYFSVVTLAEVLQDAIPSQNVRLDDARCVRGNGFEAELQSYNPQVVTLFIACYRSGDAGLEYEMGVDC